MKKKLFEAIKNLEMEKVIDFVDEEVKEEYIEAQWDNYVRDSIVDEIYDKIIEIKEAAEADEEE